MIEIQDILDQEPVRIQCGDEELIDPFPHTFTHPDLLVRRRSRMASTNHPSVRQARTQFQPASLKQINDHTSEAFGHACRRWMSQDAALIWGPRHTQRDESKQTIKRGNDMFMKEKNGKVPWKEAIKSYFVASEGTLNRRDPRKKKRAVFTRR
jgi:hypothetical protein